MGRWVPVHDEEWDGDIPLGTPGAGPSQDEDCGEVVFKGGALPWEVGKYEVSPGYLTLLTLSHTDAAVSDSLSP